MYPAIEQILSRKTCNCGAPWSQDARRRERFMLFHQGYLTQWTQQTRTITLTAPITTTLHSHRFYFVLPPHSPLPTENQIGVSSALMCPLPAFFSLFYEEISWHNNWRVIVQEHWLPRSQIKDNRFIFLLSLLIMVLNKFLQRLHELFFVIGDIPLMTWFYCLVSFLYWKV